MHKKDVSDTEIKRMMAPYLDELMRDVRPRVRVTKHEPDSKPESGKKDSGAFTITQDEKYLLESIYAEPNLSITGRSDRLGFSASKMNSLKNSVITKELAEQFSVNLGKKHGGVVKMLTLTGSGMRLINKRPKVRKPENVSHEHWWWQQVIYENYRRHDITTEIEKSLNGKRADVGIIWNGKEIAIEVELTPGNALSNIVEDLNAGFYKVASYCKDNSVLKAVKKRFQAYKDYEDIKNSVEIRLLSDIEILANIE